MKLLLATTDEEKLKKMKKFLGTLPIELVDLNTIHPAIEPIEETSNRDGNSAVLKAINYAEKTGIVALAEDNDMRLTVYNPFDQTQFSVHDETIESGLNKVKYFLQNQFSGKHVVVPFGVIIQEGKVLMGKRNDPYNPEFHGVWEFPGGCVEIGESVEENIVREIKEEMGYTVEIIGQLPFVWPKARVTETYSYQVYLIPVVCRIVGGDGKHSDHEMQEVQWHAPDDIAGLRLFPGDEGLIQKITPMIKEIIEKKKVFVC